MAAPAASGAGTGAGEARVLLLAGAMAGPLYIGVGVAQVILREGFDPRVHALSLLANGPMGWAQTLNFVLAGALVAAGAVGVRRVLAGKRGGRWAPLLLALYGVGLLHFVFGALGFYALAGCMGVFAWRYLKGGRSGWAAATAGAALVFLAGFLSMASGPPAPATMLAFYGVVALSWVWLTWALLDLRGGRGAGPEGASQGGPWS